jgi:S-formylglutathione hydrolase FrmB
MKIFVPFALFCGYHAPQHLTNIMRRLLTGSFVFLLTLVLLTQVSRAQKVEVSNLKLNSKLMGREIPYRVSVPAIYKKAGSERFPVLYLLHGLTGDYANWFDRTNLAEYAAKHDFIIVTPDGANGWYTDSLAAPKDQYESYIVKELVPEIDRSYRTVAAREGRIIAGLSMGGFGSLKFGLKYPEMFSLVGSFSGALFASSYRTPEELPAGAIRTSLVAIFGAPDSPTKKANDIFEMIRSASPERIKAMPYIYQSCGTEDFLIQNNRDFLAVMNEKKIPHEYREFPGVHNWVFWDDQVREFLDVAARRMKK